MYYPQQSPGVAHKLPDGPAWPRHPLMGPPPASPGYAVYNGVMGGHLSHPMQQQQQHHLHHHHQQQQQHHHQNSLGHYPSPPNGQAHQPGILQQSSPINGTGQVMSQHWQNQLIKCEVTRSARSPHHRARQSAMASRVTKSAIAITNPNKPSVSEPNGSPPSQEAIGNGHPSSTVAPVFEAPRPTELRKLESTWHSLDMGGVNIKTLPPTSGLFSFTFLTTLYLNHNAITSLPPEIMKLRHLELLDLSGNALSSVPAELGMLSELKELYLFDNHLTTLPKELGTLHQLQTLGVEGNPLDQSMKAIIQKEGTPALIRFLRDSCPVPPPPPERTWMHLLTDPEREALEADANSETFSLLCFNILCERCATERLYGYTPSWALAWNYRKELILQEIMKVDADFVCLQEMDVAQFEEYFTKSLEPHDYTGVFIPKSRFQTMKDPERRLVDGCATFYKRSKYTLVEHRLIDFSAIAMQRPDFKKTDDMFNRVMNKEHIALVCMFENNRTGSRFVVANAHIHWDPHYRDVKLVQTALLLDEVDSLAQSFAKYPPKPNTERPPPTYTDAPTIPTIICGDYNSIPESGVYELATNGSVPPDHPDFMGHTYGRYTSEGVRHRLGMKSSYAASGAGDLPLTNFTSGFRGHIDYIFYSAATLNVTSVLGGVDKDYLEKVVGFPNAHFPSDHLSIAAKFRVRPQRDVPTPRPVNFSSSSASPR